MWKTKHSKSSLNLDVDDDQLTSTQSSSPPKFASYGNAGAHARDTTKKIAGKIVESESTDRQSMRNNSLVTSVSGKDGIQLCVAGTVVYVRIRFPCPEQCVRT